MADHSAPTARILINHILRAFPGAEVIEDHRGLKGEEQVVEQKKIPVWKKTTKKGPGEGQGGLL